LLLQLANLVVCGYVSVVKELFNHLSTAADIADVNRLKKQFDV